MLYIFCIFLNLSLFDFEDSLEYLYYLAANKRNFFFFHNKIIYEVISGKSFICYKLLGLDLPLPIFCLEVDWDDDAINRIQEAHEYLMSLI